MCVALVIAVCTFCPVFMLFSSLFSLDRHYAFQCTIIPVFSRFEVTQTVILDTAILDTAILHTVILDTAILHTAILGLYLLDIAVTDNI